MKARFKLAVFGALCLFLATPEVAALECGSGVYTYTDLWVDEGNNNLVAINFSDGESACGDYLAYADINISFPGSYTYFDSAYESCCAEALASGPISPGEEGSIDAFSEVDYDCGDSATFLVEEYISIKITVGQRTISEENVGGKKLCYYGTACTNTTTPACPNLGAWIRVQPLGSVCENYIRSSWLAVRYPSGTNSFYVCFAGVSTATTGPGYCDPE
jgi:hypothetical protein